MSFKTSSNLIAKKFNKQTINDYKGMLNQVDAIRKWYHIIQKVRKHKSAIQWLLIRVYMRQIRGLCRTTYLNTCDCDKS